MEQLPEIILIDDVLHTLYTTPLLPWLRDQDPAPVFDRRTPSCERGYIGSWEIRDGVLWLIGLYAWRDAELTTLPDLFHGRREVVPFDVFATAYPMLNHRIETNYPVDMKGLIHLILRERGYAF